MRAPKAPASSKRTQGCQGDEVAEESVLVGTMMSSDHRGAVFFHLEDVVDGVEGRGLHLAFGTFHADPAENDEATFALGQEIVSVLGAHGVETAWSGSMRDRIHIPPFAWRKRRFTQPPIYARRAPGAPARRGPAPPPAATERARSALRASFVERGFAEVVRAGQSYVVDLRRSRRLREAWASLGAAEPGHPCDLGQPHLAVPPGDYMALGAQSALDNVREQATAMHARIGRQPGGDGAG